MSDQSLRPWSGDAIPAAAARALTIRWHLLANQSLSRWLAWGLAAGLAAYHWQYEGELPNVTFALCVTFALAAFLCVLTRRMAFALAVVTGVVTIIVWTSQAKQKTMNMVAHAYDLFFYLSSWSTFSYLWHEQRSLLVGFGAAVATSIIIGAVVWRLDTTRVSRTAASVVFVVMAALAALGAATKGERRHMQFTFEALYVSSFYASWGETLETLWNGSLLEAAGRSFTPLPAFKSPACSPAEKPPHIFMIHEESLVPPGMFPTLDYDHGLDPLFRSQDGLTHTLRVETYGGASWLTEFSILSGLSTESFGGMRQFVQTFLVNKLTDTLPQNLARCGYRNVVFYPLLKNFVSNDKFYASIGLKEVFDSKAQGAKTANERDSFYYNNALAEMQRHVATSHAPLFTYILTMSAHWPYDVVYEPNETVRGGGPGTDPEMSEYLRRLALVKRDYDAFVADLKRQFPGERILIVHYGDHQPSATRRLLGFRKEAEAEDVTMAQDAPGYLTYFAVDGINYTVPPLPAEPVIDVPYLGLIIQQAARLPLSDAWRERQRLMEVCHGRNYGCRPRSNILSFHRRLIDSGIIQAR